MQKTRQYIQRRRQLIPCQYDMALSVRLTHRRAEQYWIADLQERQFDEILHWHRQGLRYKYDSLLVEKIIYYGICERWSGRLKCLGYMPGMINSFLAWKVNATSWVYAVMMKHCLRVLTQVPRKYLYCLKCMHQLLHAKIKENINFMMKQMYNYVLRQAQFLIGWRNASDAAN